MYCWNCGKQIEDSVSFCPYCGIRQAAAPEQPKARKEAPKNFLIPVICAAVCVGALLGMILLLAGDKEDPAPPAITQEKAELETTKATEAKETEAPKKEAARESSVDPYSAELPDLASFLDTEYTQDEWGYTHYVTCLVDDDDNIVKAVLDLLLEPRYQLKLMDKDSDSEGTHYTYEYTGKNGDIDWVYLKSGGQYHVKLTVKPYGSSQNALILYSFPEFYLEDPGVTWKDQKADPVSDPVNPAPAPVPTPSAGKTIEVRGDTTVYIKSGSAVELVCTYDENSQYDVYNWSIVSGSSKISINKQQGKGCTVTGLSAGEAQIKMVYKYGVTGPNVLTGLPEPQEKSKTSTYTIIVE